MNEFLQALTLGNQWHDSLTQMSLKRFFSCESEPREPQPLNIS